MLPIKKPQFPVYVLNLIFSISSVLASKNSMDFIFFFQVFYLCTFSGVNLWHLILELLSISFFIMRVVMEQSTENTFLKFMALQNVRLLHRSFFFILLHLIFKHLLSKSIIFHSLGVLIPVQVTQYILFHIRKLFCHFLVLIIFMHELGMLVIQPHILSMFSFYLFVVSSAFFLHLGHSSYVAHFWLSLMLHKFTFMHFTYLNVRQKYISFKFVLLFLISYLLSLSINTV